MSTVKQVWWWISNDPLWSEHEMQKSWCQVWKANFLQGKMEERWHTPFLERLGFGGGTGRRGGWACKWASLWNLNRTRGNKSSRQQWMRSQNKTNSIKKEIQLKRKRISVSSETPQPEESVEPSQQQSILGDERQRTTADRALLFQKRFFGTVVCSDNDHKTSTTTAAESWRRKNAACWRLNMTQNSMKWTFDGS